MAKALFIGSGRFRTFRAAFRQRCHLDRHSELALKQLRLSVLNEMHSAYILIYRSSRLIKMAQRRQFRSVHSMHYKTKYVATADQATDQFFDFYFAVTNCILPWRILFCRGEFYFAAVNCILLWRIVFCRGEFYFAVANFILPRWIVFCREEFYFAVVNCILPWRILFCREEILFCREEFYFAVTVVGHRRL